MTKKIHVAVLAAAVLFAGGEFAVAAPAQTLLLECEGFDELGGWVIDTQVMDQMGSPYVMAHGLGRPVADATTKVAFPARTFLACWCGLATDRPLERAQPARPSRSAWGQSPGDGVRHEECSLALAGRQDSGDRQRPEHHRHCTTWRASAAVRRDRFTTDPKFVP